MKKTLMVIRMLTELGSRMEELNENGCKDLENVSKNQSELKNTISEMKIY